jgi:YidC/Oxa1 family membrane protein insertase
MFEGFFDLLGSILNFFYTLIPSYGVAIMLLTVLVMLLITPLTVKSTRSMLQMQRLQPEMKRIQAKYKDDREKLNEELMKFYRENQINPLGGCLPLIAQMPVFIIMYQLLRGLTTRQGGLGSGIGHIGGQVQQNVELTPWIFTDQFFQPQHLNPDTELYQSLSQTNTMNFLGLDLAISPSQALQIGLIAAIPYFILLLIMLGTGIYQNRQLQARNTSANVNPQQQMIMKVMPFFLPVFSFGFPSGLPLYWCTQNFCRIGTNAYITRSVYRKEHEGDAVETTAVEKDKDAKPGKDAASKEIGKGSGSKGSGGKGSGGASKKGSKAAAANGSGSNGSNGAAAERNPGKSVKSQKAHQNAVGRKSGGGSGSGSRTRSGSGRKSGEPRSGAGNDEKE